MLVVDVNLRAEVALEEARLSWTLPPGAISDGARTVPLGTLAAGAEQTHTLRVRLPDGEGVIAAAVQVGSGGTSTARSVALRIGDEPDRGERVVELPDGTKLRAVRARGNDEPPSSALVPPVDPSVKVQGVE